MNARKGCFALLTACVFCIFCMIGRRFDEEYTISFIPQGNSVPGMIKEFCLLTLFLLAIICVLLFLFNNRFVKSFWEKESSIYSRKLHEKPFIVSFLTLLIGYTPYIIISYPSVFMGDDFVILGEGFGAYALTSHHPVAFNLFVSKALKFFHHFTGSWNKAVFIYSLLQLLFVIGVLSYGVHLLIREAGVKSRPVFVLLVFYIISPVVSNYMFMLTKDVLYAVFIFLYGQSLFCIFKHGWSYKNLIAISLSCIGVYLFRNEGLYVILLSLLVSLLTNRTLRRGLKYCFLEIVVLHLVLSRIVWPSMGVEEGSKREMLSILFLQTGRYVRDCRDEVTEEEEKVLLAAFSFKSLDEMAAAYNPDLADGIKNYFVLDTSTEEAVNYYKVWASMGRKKPKVYLDAVLDNNYQYFYPSVNYESYSYAWSDYCLSLVNETIGTDFHYPSETAGYREYADYLRDDVFRKTPYSVLNNPGLLTWFLLSVFFIVLYKRSYDDLHYLVPLFVIMAICIASPCNGYYSRYQYPLQLFLPWICLMVIQKPDSNRQTGNPKEIVH